MKQMRGKQNREPQLAMKAQNDLPQFVNAFGVQSVARLVQDQKLRIGQQRLRQREPRAHPMRIRPHFGMFAPSQSHPVNDLIDSGSFHWRGVAA